MSFPEIPPQLQGKFTTQFPGFWDWYRKAKKIWDTLDATKDILSIDKGGSLILRNSSGTLTKRVRLNDTGDGLIFEDV